MGLDRYFLILWRRKGLFLAALAAFLVAALILCFAPTPIYSSKAQVTLMLNPLELRLVDGVPDRYGGFSYSDQRFDYLLNSLVEILESSEVVQPIIDKLQLRTRKGETMPYVKFAGTGIMTRLMTGKGVNADYLTESEVLEISGYSTDLEESAAIANGLIESFQEYFLRSHREGGTRALRAMEGQLRVVEAKLRDAEKRRMEQRIASLDIDLGADTGSSQIASLVGDYSEAETGLVTLHRTHQETLATQRILAEMRETMPEFRKATESMTHNTVIDTYKAQILSDLVNYHGKRVELTDNHPDVQALKASIEATRKELEAEVKSVLGASEMSRNTDFDTLTTTMVENEIDLQTYPEYVKILEDVLEKRRQQLARIPGIAFESAPVTRDATSYESDVTDLMTSIRQLQLALTIPFRSVSVIHKATVDPEQPKENRFFPRRKVLVALGGMIGALFSLMLVLTVDGIDTRLRLPEDLEGIPALGLPALFPAFRGGSMRPSRPGAKALRAALNLRAYVRAVCDPQPATLAVTSPQNGDGKSAIASLLAVASARSGIRTALIDADIWNPALGRLFGGARSDMAEALASPEAMVDALRPSGVANLDLVALAKTSSPPLEGLESFDWSQLYRLLRERYGFIVVDLSGVNVGAECIRAAARADAALLVVRAGRNTRTAIERVAKTLQDAGVRTAASVLNRVA